MQILFIVQVVEGWVLYADRKDVQIKEGFLRLAVYGGLFQWNFIRRAGIVYVIVCEEYVLAIHAVETDDIFGVCLICPVDAGGAYHEAKPCAASRTALIIIQVFSVCINIWDFCVHQLLDLRLVRTHSVKGRGVIGVCKVDIAVIFTEQTVIIKVSGCVSYRAGGIFGHFVVVVVHNSQYCDEYCCTYDAEYDDNLFFHCMFLPVNCNSSMCILSL